MSAPFDARSAFPAWWETRSVRERRLLAFAALLVIALGLWFGLVAPLRAAERRAEQGHARAVERLIVVETVARQVAALQKTRGQKTGGSAAGRPLTATVVQSSLSAGVPLARQQLAGDGGLEVQVDRADPGAFFRWIALLGRDQGVAVGAMDMARNPDGTIRARIVLAGDSA